MKSFTITFLVLSALVGLVLSQASPSPSQVSRRRRAVQVDPSSEEARCPAPLTSCPIMSLNKRSKLPVSSKDASWECVNLQEELTSCGSCGKDCMSTPNAENVGCQAGKCKIFTCKAGYAIRRQLDEPSSMMVDTCA